MAKLTSNLAAYPARTSFTWYLGLILVGTMLLMLPVMGGGETPISFLDALFTATSAACVTGLGVRSTGHDFSFAGQMVILLLIQLGGIGIMTVTTYVTFQLGGRAGLRERAIIAETLGGGENPDLRWVLRNVLWMSFGIELLGAALLLPRFIEGTPLPEAVWSAVFHSISAFCNAGFSLYDDSLVRFRGDVWVNLTITTLIVLGGLGFPVMLDLRRNWRRRWRDLWNHLSLHTKIMVIGTVGLILVGMFAFLILEWDNILRGRPLEEKLLTSYFQSVTCRTAGFNTVAIGELTNATLFIMILLMTIGGGPCSTAGGFKVSTFMSLVLRAWSTYRGYSKINVYRRTLEPRNVERATTTALIFGVVAVVALTTMVVVEQAAASPVDSDESFLDAMFEVVSALGTVGLSTGLTVLLSDASRYLLIVLMFMGRLGPISMFAALSRHQRPQRREYPHEELLIG